jgi:hypothetical protein
MATDDRAARIERIQRIERIKALEAGGGDAGDSDNGSLNSAVSTGLRGLDYQRANVGGPALARVLKAMGGKDAAPGVDMAKVRSLKADFPGSGQMLQNSGVMGEEPGPIEKVLRAGAMGNPMTALPLMAADHVLGRNGERAALGMGLDVASDPMTYESEGVSALAKLKNLGKMAPVVRSMNMVMNPMEEFFKWRAGANYNKAFEKINEVAKDMRKPLLPGKLLEEQGFQGNAREAAQALHSINKTEGANIGSILDQSAARGAGVDPWTMLHDAVGKAKELRDMGIPEATKLADDVENRAMELWRNHGAAIPVDKANELKTFLDEQIKQAGHLAGPEASIGKQGQKDSANALRAGVDNAVATTTPDLAAPFQEAKQRFASTDKNIYKKAREWARTAPEMAGALGLSKVDLMLAGAGAGGGYYTGNSPLDGALGALALKKGAGALMSTSGRTMRGKIAQEAARIGGGTMDPLLRQAPRSVWEALQQNNGDQ